MAGNIEGRVRRLERDAADRECRLAVIWRYDGQTPEAAIDGHLERRPSDADCKLLVIGWMAS